MQPDNLANVQFVSAVPVESGRAFSYDAVDQRGARKRPPVNHRSEDEILDSGKRSLALSNARDIARNFSIAAWMVRKHLDYVATFEFHGRCEDDGLNDELEAFVQEWSRPDNFDAAARHPLDRFVRIGEARAVLDGDFGVLKLADGTVQGLESDRIRNPTKVGRDDRWVQGVKVNKVGKALAYGIHRRCGNGFEFEKTVGAGNVCMHGYYDRFDQIRGVSPIMSGLNPMRDVYENVGYALAKSKVEQLFALAIYRESDKSLIDTDQDPRGRYKMDFGRGPVLLDMNWNDRAEFLNSSNPSSQFKDFMIEVLQIALKSLDIPFSFYDEGHTNFFGSRGAWLHYERSCLAKREALGHLLQRLTIWRLWLGLLDGDFKLPSGMSLSDVGWEWVPLGMPWWDAVKEISGDLAAVGGCLDDPFRIVKQRGKGDLIHNIKQRAKAERIAKEHGVQLSFAPIPIVVEKPDDRDAKDK